MLQNKALHFFMPLSCICVLTYLATWWIMPCMSSDNQWVYQYWYHWKNTACRDIWLAEEGSCFLYSLQYKQQKINDWVIFEGFQEKRYIHVHWETSNSWEKYSVSMVQAWCFNGGTFIIGYKFMCMLWVNFALGTTWYFPLLWCMASNILSKYSPEK